LKFWNRSQALTCLVVVFAFGRLLSGCGSSGGGGGNGGGGVQIPAVPTGVTATPGNAQVVLTWSEAANGLSPAPTFHVKRSTTSGGPYTQVGAPTAATYTDTGLTNGTAYYYVVSAVNSAGESANSLEVTATPLATTSVTVNIDTLSNRHAISPYVYGGAYPQDAAHVTDSGLTVVRWGGDATSTYNWQLQTYNAANDYYYEDYNSSGFSSGNADSDSIQFVENIETAGSNPLMTMVMLPWVAQSAENGSNGHWSFSVAKYGAQCSVDQYNTDAGNGVVAGASCASSPTYITGNDPNDAYVPLKDDPAGGDPAGTVYRHAWATALATAFGSAPHFYNMDNEPEIWGSTHRDIHPSPSAYEELRDTYIQYASELKTWDPAAIRLGPITCCWWFYWNGANSNDKPNHAGQDFLPWWVNEVYWRDQISGVPSVEVLDVHAYPDSPDTSTYTQAQKQALAVRIYRDYWDSTYTSESGGINQIYTTQIQPNHAIPFRIPRLRAIYNSTYPGIPMSITEWSAAFAGESDFSTAIGDADSYGILGRERVYLASRWGAPLPANPNYQALKLYTNYDGAHHMFGTTSVSATHNADPNLFSVYAALGTGGSSLTIMVLNKDPGNSAIVNFQINNFSGTSCTAYTLSQSSPNAIVSSSCQANGSMTFAPYTATLLVLSGALTSVPAAEWDLNPDTTMVPAGGTATLNPIITSGTSGATVTLTAASFDSGGGTMSITNGNVTQAPSNAAITVTAGTTPGFYHYTVTSKDSSNVIQKQGGWIIVGNPPATFTQTGNGQTGDVGTPLTLSVTLVPGTSGATSGAGATIRFTTDAGTLSGGTAGNATTQLVTTNSSGVASVTLTLPATAGPVNVLAEGPYQLGHPVVKFSETAQ